ncbi:MAG: PQQ-binding-like beta-propeller repeat protein [Pseudomonadota bacterium]
MPFIPLSFRHLVLIFALLLAPGLTACSSGPIGAVGGLFGGDDDDDQEEAEKEEEDDDRISILAFEETLTADPRYAGTIVDLPPSYKNLSWPQPGGEADHTLHHLSSEVALEKVWKTDIGKASARRARLTSPPVVADGRLYVSDAEATVSAYDIESGDVIWERELAPEFKEKFRIRDILSRQKKSQLGFGGGVAYDSGRIFITSGFRFLAAINAESGEQLWMLETDAPIRTPPTAHRGLVYAVTITNELIAVDQETGEKQWGFQSFEENARILSSASPAAAGDLVVAPFSSGEVVAFLANTGRPVWNDTLSRSANLTSLASLNDIAGSPVIDRGLVYVVSHAGRLTAIDIRSGSRIWEVPIASLQMPWVAGDYIFLISVDAELVCISREDGGIIWLSQLERYKKEKKKKGRIAWAGPVLAGDHLILVSTDGKIAKVSAQTGEIVETEKLGEGAVVSPIVADEKVFVLTEAGDLIALQ